MIRKLVPIFLQRKRGKRNTARGIGGYKLGDNERAGRA